MLWKPKPGVWKKKILEKEYRGDLFRNVVNKQNSGQVNDNINISNQISIVADPYANNHCYAILYAEIRGAKWKVTSVDIQYPRLILTIGGLYNGTSA